MPLQQSQLHSFLVVIGLTLTGGAIESSADEREDWQLIQQIFKERRENPNKKIDTTKLLKERAEQKAARDKQQREQQQRANTSSIPLSELGIRQGPQSNPPDSSRPRSTWPGTPQPGTGSKNNSLYSSDRYQPTSPRPKQAGTQPAKSAQPAGFNKAYAATKGQGPSQTRSANRAQAGIDDLSAEDETIFSTRQPTSIDVEYTSCEEYERAGISCGKPGPIFGIPEGGPDE